jgi:hypothetical protein
MHNLILPLEKADVRIIKVKDFGIHSVAMCESYHIHFLVYMLFVLFFFFKCNFDTNHCRIFTGS